MLVLAGWAGAGKGVDPQTGTKSLGRLEEHPPFPQPSGTGAPVPLPIGRIGGSTSCVWVTCHLFFRFDYDCDDDNDDFSTATTGCGMCSSEMNEMLVAWWYGRVASYVFASFSTPTTCIESLFGTCWTSCMGSRARGRPMYM